MNQTIVIDHPHIHSILASDARLEQLTSGAKHTEGPVYLPDDSVVFSDVSGDRLWRWSKTDGATIIHQAQYIYHNGNALYQVRMNS